MVSSLGFLPNKNSSSSSSRGNFPNEGFFTGTFWKGEPSYFCYLIEAGEPRLDGDLFILVSYAIGKDWLEPNLMSFSPEKLGTSEEGTWSRRLTWILPKLEEDRSAFRMISSSSSLSLLFSNGEWMT